MKNVKYYAGLFDADGSFDMWPTKRKSGLYYINIKASLYQKDKAILEPLASHYDVPICKSGVVYCVTLHGSKAQSFMETVRQYLVIKQPVVDYLLSIKGTTVEDISIVRSNIQAHRKLAAPEKPWPSRKWMAGYVDGDGCFHSSFRKKDGCVEFKLAVVSHVSQMAGLSLMQKAFGGRIYEQDDVRKWAVTLSISKGKQILNYFSKHLEMKKEQAALILDCLETRKHFKSEGASYESNLKIHLQLQELKLPATTKSENAITSDVIV